MPDLPPFIEAHPPKMTSPDVLPTSPTQSVTKGTPYVIEKKYFDLVFDPKYPWQKMPKNSEKEWEKRKETKAKKTSEVDHYVVVRELYWEMTNKQMYPGDTEIEITNTYGTSYTHETSKTETTTQKIGAELGLSLGGDLMNPGAVPPAVPPVPMALAAAEGGDGGGSGLSAKLTWEMSHTLEFKETDTRTYTQEHTEKVTQHLLGGYQYLFWQTKERLLLYRAVAGVKEPVPEGEVEMAKAQGGTSNIYIDRFHLWGGGEDKDNS
jgi:hypothetical protein